MKDLIKELGFSTAKLYLEKLLSSSHSGHWEIKEIIYNGVFNRISFIIHFYKPKQRGNKILSYFREEFGVRKYLPFPYAFKINVKTALLDDITAQVLKHEHVNTIVNLEELVRMPIKDFIIHATGPFKIDVHDLIYSDGRDRPTFESSTVRIYTIKVIFYKTSFITENLSLMDIPLELDIPVEFINETFLTKTLEDRRQYLEKSKTKSRKDQVFEKSFEQAMGFPIERFGDVLWDFMKKLQIRVQNRFNEFLLIENPENLEISKVTLANRQILGELPKLYLRISFLLDYNKESDRYINISLRFKKDVFYKIASKVWRKTYTK